jgi:alkylhydroperoxidase/carboxymuconolactone decarboxylase family protein YurZ
MSEHPLSPIEKLDKTLFDGIMANYAKAYEPGALSQKQKLLIALAIDASKGAVNGVRSLARFAKTAGATHAEIADTLSVVYQICGVGSMYTAAAGLAEVMTED